MTIKDTIYNEVLSHCYNRLVPCFMVYTIEEVFTNEEFLSILDSNYKVKCAEEAIHNIRNEFIKDFTEFYSEWWAAVQKHLSKYETDRIYRKERKEKGYFDMKTFYESHLKEN